MLELAWNIVFFKTPLVSYKRPFVPVYTYMCIYIYAYITCVFVCVCVYTYMHI